MPKKGFKVVTIRDAVNKKINELARKLSKSAPEVIELAVDNFDADAYTEKVEAQEHGN